MVPVLLRHGARPGRLRQKPARVREAHLAARLAEVGLRRRHVRSQCGGPRQPGPRRRRHPQLPLAARTRRRRAEVRRSGRAACRISGHRGSYHHPGRGCERRAAPGPQRLREKVLWQVRAPARRRRRRAQPAAGSPAGFRPSRHRHRHRKLTGIRGVPYARECGTRRPVSATKSKEATLRRQE